MDEMERYWICVVKGTDGGKGFKHKILPDAMLEAERLANITGKEVNVYGWEGCCKPTFPPVKWELPR